MTKLSFLAAIAGFGLYAQNPVAFTPSATGVSLKFSDYAALNPLQPEGEGEVEVPNQFYIPRTASTSKPKANALALTPAPSTMFNQTTNGNLPVTVQSNLVGLGNGFNGWTNQGLLPPDTTLAVGAGQIVQWVNLRLTVLNKTNGALLLGGAGYVNGNQESEARSQ